MSSSFSLNWATLAVSIFNTILLFWLGLTVLLNTERRSLGVWLAGVGLLMSGLFFLSHTAILGIGSFQADIRNNLWWRTGWIPVISMPFAWYLVMLWYSSYWDDRKSIIHRRHQVPLVLASLLAVSTVGMVLLFHALPSYNQLVQLDLGGVLSIQGIPVLMFVYPIYLVICIGFSLDVLLHPGAPARLMGQLARHRARPWLVLATLALLLVSLAVGLIIVWGFYNLSQYGIPAQFVLTITAFDLVIALLLAVTILSAGQAIVSYEVFTGKILPRQGLKRYWTWAILLALGYGIFVSWALLLNLEPIYIILLSIVLTTGLYAFLGWRSFIDQEHILKSLHPFISSQHLYDQLILQNPETYDLQISDAFQALCEDILGVRRGFLIPMGIFGPLIGGAIAYPSDSVQNEYENLQLEVRRVITTNPGPAPLLLTGLDDFAQNPLAIPLLSERGMIGVLVLGDKNNASLFTQEEVEIARTVGERLIDSKASNELAHRLMEHERRQVAETRVIDQQTRRILHDEILPRLQSLMIQLSSSPDDKDHAVKEMGEIHHQLANLMHNLPVMVEPEIVRLGLLDALQISINTEYRSCFDSVTWQITEAATEKSKSFTPYISNVLYHATREAVRNAAHHGRQSVPACSLDLAISITWQEGLKIKVEDNGAGFNLSALEGGKNGHGLAIHSTLMAVIGGSLSVESIPGKYSRVILYLPV
jgi:signal transduction histidine kinase